MLFRSEPDTAEAVIVSFEVPADLQQVFGFTQGQYLTLRHEIDGQDLRRSYSICAGLDDGELRVGVRKVRGGVFSNWINASLKPGDTIQVMAPQGRFFVPIEPGSARHHVGIAGGSGITPILSIMKTVLAREPHSRFTLIYGNRRPATAMFKEELEDLKNRYLTRVTLHHVFSREHVDAPLMQGRLDKEKLAAFLQGPVPAASVDEVFICGPFEMNEQAEAALAQAGVPAERIHIERFGTPDMQQGRAAPHEVHEEDAEAARVVVIRDGVSREIDFRRSDPSLLDAHAGLAGIRHVHAGAGGWKARCAWTGTSRWKSTRWRPVSSSAARRMR